MLRVAKSGPAPSSLGDGFAPAGGTGGRERGRGPHGPAGVQERARDLGVVAGGGPVKRRHPVALRGVGVGPLPEEGAHRLQVAALGRVRDR